MNDKILKKATEILVECGYALRSPGCGLIRLTEGAFANEEYVTPFFDDIQGRRQADAIEDWLNSNVKNTQLWHRSIMAFGFPPNKHKWRLDRIKWCLQELVK